MKEKIIALFDTINGNLKAYGDEGKFFGIFGKSNLDRLNEIKGDEKYKIEIRQKMRNRINDYKKLTGFRRYFMKTLSSVEKDIALLQYFELEEAISTANENMSTNIGGSIIFGIKLSIQSFLEKISRIFYNVDEDFYFFHKIVLIKLSINNFKIENSEWLKPDDSPTQAKVIKNFYARSTLFLSGESAEQDSRLKENNDALKSMTERGCTPNNGIRLSP